MRDCRSKREDSLDLAPVRPVNIWTLCEMIFHYLGSSQKQRPKSADWEDSSGSKVKTTSGLLVQELCLKLLCWKKLWQENAACSSWFPRLLPFNTVGSNVKVCINRVLSLRLWPRVFVDTSPSCQTQRAIHSRCTLKTTLFTFICCLLIGILSRKTKVDFFYTN